MKEKGKHANDSAIDPHSAFARREKGHEGQEEQGA
jgi:hypothetical protein